MVFEIFSISATIQDDGQNFKKSKHFRGPNEVALSTLGGQKFARNLLRFSKSLEFSICAKIQDGG